MLKEYINNENRNNDIQLELIGSNCEKPIGIEVRYSAAKYYNHTSDTYEEIAIMTMMRSHSTMYLTTDYEMFARGIVSFKIASRNHNYKEEYIIAALSCLANTIRRMK